MDGDKYALHLLLELPGARGEQAEAQRLVDDIDPMDSYAIELAHRMRSVEYVLTRADLVWNRTIGWGSFDPDEDPDDFAGPVGDRHMRALAKPYGRAMGSGIDAVRDTSSPEECRRAADAFAYLGLPDLAEMFRRLADIPLSAEGGGRGWPCDRAFWGLELALVGAFERKYAESPEDFGPVSADGVERRHGSWPDGDRVCVGDLLVHERVVGCSRGERCPGLRPGLKHSRSRLHTDADCDLCPSGPAWPYTGSASGPPG